MAMLSNSAGVTSSDTPAAGNDTDRSPDDDSRVASGGTAIDGEYLLLFFCLFMAVFILTSFDILQATIPRSRPPSRSTSLEIRNMRTGSMAGVGGKIPPGKIPSLSVNLLVPPGFPGDRVISGTIILATIT